MMGPRYRDVKSVVIPEVTVDSGVKIKVICGQINGIEGPVADIVTDPEYLDVSVPAGSSFRRSVKKGYTAFAYVLEGNGHFDKSGLAYGPRTLVIFDDGDEVQITTGNNAIRFLLVSGKPIRQPVAWYGPIVMNTEEELRTAFEEYASGRFLK
jgi:redox-sensitive bicupin YhaK (pirin superfamily)